MQNQHKIIAYIRVSTQMQSTENQKLAILEYASKHQFQVDEFIEITASTRKSKKDRKIDLLLSKLQKGDTLIVAELSRLGRSLGQIVQIVDTLIKEGIKLISIKENININGKKDLQTTITTALFGIFSEIEQELISSRTKEGLAKARASGKTLGRPKGSLGESRLNGKEEEIRHFLSLGVSKSSIAKITGVSRPTLYHFINSRNLQTS